MRRALTSWRQKYPLFGSALALGLLGCQQWQAQRLPLPAVRAAGAPPLLVIGTVNDPATPYASARVLAKTLATAPAADLERRGAHRVPEDAVRDHRGERLPGLAAAATDRGDLRRVGIARRPLQ